MPSRGAVAGRHVAPGTTSGSAPCPPDAARRESMPPSADFTVCFESAFAELDRQKGSHNFVSLVDLRRALPTFSREQFDRGLGELRAAGRFGLSAAESIHGIRTGEREAGIEEAGTLLVNVSRKS
jgi:hypothetical protein